MPQLVQNWTIHSDTAFFQELVSFVFWGCTLTSLAAVFLRCSGKNGEKMPSWCWSSREVALFARSMASLKIKMLTLYLCWRDESIFWTLRWCWRYFDWVLGFMHYRCLNILKGPPQTIPSNSNHGPKHVLGLSCWNGKKIFAGLTSQSSTWLRYVLFFTTILASIMVIVKMMRIDSISLRSAPIQDQCGDMPVERNTQVFATWVRLIFLTWPCQIHLFISLFGSQPFPMNIRDVAG